MNVGALVGLGGVIDDDASAQSMDRPETVGVARIERVSLREVWRHEAYDFTRWLEHNVDALNDVLDISLVNVARERAAGSFSIDLVAEDESGQTVVIENQLDAGRASGGDRGGLRLLGRRSIDEWSTR